MSAISFQKVEDAQHICHLLQQFHCVFPHLLEKISSLDEYARKLSEKAFVYQMLDGSQTCGFLALYANDRAGGVAYLALIGLLPQWQGKKLGRTLLELCEEKARTEGMTALRLEVDLDNARAIRFYNKMGYAPDGAPNENSAYMRKELSVRI